MDKIKPFIILRDKDSNIPVSKPPYTPGQIRMAYNFNEKYTGIGNTIAIIVAFGNANIVSDLEVFNRRFNLPDADIEVLFPQGRPQEADLGWAAETSLDVQWAHALAPEAKIILVVAKNSNSDSLFEATRFALGTEANIISMSWGVAESTMALEYDEIFKDRSIVFLASSGDSGITSYPATSPYVVGVGGTSMQLNEIGERIVPETGWYFTGGGISSIEFKPQYQYIINDAIPKTNMLTSPDVSFFADTFPGVEIYVTFEGVGQWLAAGGTSVSCPCVAAIIADALPAGYTLNSSLELLYSFYDYSSEYDNAYFDVKNGNTDFFPAIKGYDYVTGLGSPNISNFIDEVRKKLEDCC